MSFCNSGDSALNRLAESPTDVVVTDMRMPGMDGAQLLTQIRERYPDTVRMILSGHSDQEMTLRAVGPAHRYLTKPCQPELLLSAIESALDLHSRVVSREVRQLVESVDTLPVLPEVYLELIAELRKPTSSIETAGRIIASDLGISAKILQLVNSAFFGLPVRVTDVPHAVALLGLGVIRPLVLSAGVFGQYERAKLGDVSLSALTTHSMQVASLARRLAEIEIPELSADDLSDVYLCGLLHDVGKLVLAQARGKEYSDLLSECRGDRSILHARERELFGATHGELGGHLLQLWGLSAPLVEAVALHHEPSLSGGNYFSPLTAIHAAEALVSGEVNWDEPYLDRIGLTERIDSWKQEALADG